VIGRRAGIVAAAAVGGLALSALVVGRGPVAGCGGAPPAPDPTPAPPSTPAPTAAPPAPPDQAPDVAFRMPALVGTSPAVVSATPDVDRARERLIGVVRGHARDPENPWAIVHAMLALGVDEKLSNGADPVDWLFSEYAEVRHVGDEDLLTFPVSAGGRRVEPHTDLVLKGLTEGGVPPGRQVKVRDGRSFQVAALYRSSLQRAWVKGTVTGFQEHSWNDTPWALQGLAAWAPPELGWTAAGGRPMSLDGFTTAVVDQLELETRILAQAKAQGIVARKDTREGIFAYTCGGSHLLMGAAYAVGRGYGAPADRARVCTQHELWRYRIDVELGAIDPVLQSGRLDGPTTALLLSQRLKFLGHWLEVSHKTLAMQVCPPSPEDAAATKRVVAELVRTVDALEQVGVLAALPVLRTDPAWAAVPRGPEQLYLDLLGDSAHALRGLDLATGRASITY
jgi:hypothetical protein